MEHYDVTIDIDATPEHVWEVLTSGDYAAWDAGIKKVEGTVADGSRIKVWSHVSPDRAFPVKVSLDPPAHTMTWRGGMPIPGLFTGVRTFHVEPAGEGTRFAMREEFTGVLLGPIFRSMPDLGPSFQQFARGLKAQAEASAAT